MPAKEGRVSHLVTDRWVGQWTDIVRFTGRKLVTVPSQNAQVYDSEADSIIRYPPRRQPREANVKFEVP